MLAGRLVGGMDVSCEGAGTPSGAIAHSVVGLSSSANGICRAITVVNGHTGRVTIRVGRSLRGGLRRFTSCGSGLRRIFRGERRVRVSHCCRGLPGPALVTTGRCRSNGICCGGPTGRGGGLWLVSG